MPNTAHTTFLEQDNTFSPTTPARGISGVLGVTKRGPINNPGLLINSWPQYVKLYGGLMTDNDFPLLCKRALERGSSLRVSRVVHYTDITNSATLTAEYAAVKNTSLITLSGALAATHTIGVTINGNIVAPVTFSGDSSLTLKALGEKVLQSFPGIIRAYQVTSNTTLALVPQAGVTITTLTVQLGGTTPPTATTSTVSSFTNATGNTALFQLSPKYPGSEYNKLVITLSKGSNYQANYFDLQIQLLGEPDTVENWPNLRIEGSPTVANSNYLQAITNGSNLVNVTYADLSSLVSPIVPRYMTLSFDAGDDGDAVTATDFIGDSNTRTGLQAFNGVDDIFQLCAPTREDASVHQAGAAYASSRKDLVYFAHLSNTLTSENALVSAKLAMNIDSSYTAFFSGGLIVLDPLSGQNKNISELGDILGIAATSDSSVGPWQSFAGSNRGLFYNALGVVNNFGTPANLAGMNLIANAQINAVINRDNKIMLWGNFTGQLANSTLSFLNVRRFIIELKKTLGPILSNFLEEANDPITWRLIYMAVDPTLRSWVNKRAMHDYDWQGDQFVDSIDNAVINTPQLVQQGKYYVKLFIKPTVSLQEIVLGVILSPSGVSFEDLLGLETV